MTTKTKLDTVAEMWESYVRDVLPSDASEVQVSETRLAFYAGVHAMFIAAVYGIGNDDVSEERGSDYLDEIEQELKRHVAGLLGGITMPRMH